MCQNSAVNAKYLSRRNKKRRAIVSSHSPERVEEYEQYSKNPKEFHKILTELGFTYVDDGCDGYCPEYEKKDDCEVYLELKDNLEDIDPDNF